MVDDRMRETILAFAECDMSILKTSKKTNYHWNTIMYHLEKTRKKTGLNPRRFYDLVKLVEMVKEDGDSNA